MKVMRVAGTVLLMWLAGLTAMAQVPQPPLEAYGELPKVRDMTISPDGSVIAFITRDEGVDLITVYDAVSGDFSHRVRLDNVSTRDIWFADRDHLMIFTSDTSETYYGNFKYEFSAAASLDLRTNDLTWMLYKARGLSAYQSGLGRVVGHDDGHGTVFMPAYMGKPGDDPSKDLLRVDLKTGRGKVHKRGTPLTTDWLVDPDGTVIAREDYSNATNEYEIVSYRSGKKETVFKAKGAVPPYSIVGIKDDRSALILAPTSGADEEYTDLIEVGFDGHIGPAGLSRPGADIEHIYSDPNQSVSGVRYSGALPSYKFYDPEVDQAVAAVVAGFPTSAVFVTSRSEDWSKILYLIYDNNTTGQYVLQDRATGQLMGIATRRADIPNEAVADISVVKYPARDGLSIPAILTWPVGTDASARKNLPLVVMPHGGPASHDYVQFDWMAQYFANRGYLVLQPNFRGSDGYGKNFQEAGYGEWGGKMQDDVTDGVLTLIQNGTVDPQRICIVGGSYGGYAALAGGAYTPGLYKCVVAIAPVTDLPLMIKDEAEFLQQNHWIVAYLKEAIGDIRRDRSRLEAISPVNAADQFLAPVLLIHGDDDTVVPLEQSEVMAKALEAKGKSVTFIKLKSEDHWLSHGASRKAALRAAGKFVDDNIGAD